MMTGARNLRNMRTLMASGRGSALQGPHYVLEPRRNIICRDILNDRVSMSETVKDITEDLSFIQVFAKTSKFYIMVPLCGYNNIHLNQALITFRQMSLFEDTVRPSSSLS